MKKTVINLEVVPDAYKGFNMKKILIVFIVLFSFDIIANAQDVIFLRNGDEIQSIVQEIGIEYVKYKKFDNQNGPIYNIAISDIFMIKYENGTKDLFKETLKSQEQKVEQPKQTHQDDIKNESQIDLKMKNLKAEFYRIGTDDDLMLIYFKKNNYLDYYNSFASACKSRHRGSDLLVFGLINTVLGIGCAVTYANNNKEIYLYTAYGFCVLGEVLTIISIPVSASAGARKKAIKNNFEREYFGNNQYSSQPTLNFGATQNGIGLTLNF